MFTKNVDKNYSKKNYTQMEWCLNVYRVIFLKVTSVDIQEMKARMKINALGNFLRLLERETILNNYNNK